jgi:hypothetical protein
MREEVAVPERIQTRISAELLEELRRVADEQGRSEEELFEDAVRFYLVSRFLFTELSELQDVDISIVRRTEGDVRNFFQRVAAWQKERGVTPPSDEDAMRIADEELHAFRRGE